MTILQSFSLPQDSIKSRWQEPYVTAGLNQKALASDMRGVVLGWTVLPFSGYQIIIQPDATLGLSIANVTDTSGDKFSLSLVHPSAVFFDLTLQAGTTVYVVLDAQYSTGSASGGQARIVDAAELGTNPDLILLAKVDVPASPPVLAININTAYRLSAGDSLPPEALPPYNLIANGTFERDTAGSAPNGWSLLSGALTATVDATVSRTGTQSLKLLAASPVTASYGSNFMVVEAGQLARAGAWIRSTSGTPIASGSGVSLSVTWYDPSYSALGTTTPLEGAFTGGSATFARRAFEVIAPVGAAFARVVITYTACSGTLYVDDVQFIVRGSDVLARAAVFGGNNSVADQFHSHTALGLTYAGSANWADGTSLPAGSIEGAIDGIVTAVGGVSGALKVGYTPTTPVDLTGVTRVDQALDTLDDQKASLTHTNAFTKTNAFTPSVLNTSGITITGNGTAAGIVANAVVGGTGAGILALAGSTAGGPAIGAVALGSNIAVDAEAAGTGAAVRGQSLGGVGVVGIALAGNGAGVSGQGSGAGPGGTFTGGPTGHGGVFQAGANGFGLLAMGGSTIVAGYGVYGIGSTNNGIGVRGDGRGTNYGVWGNGGPGNGTSGVHGDGGGGNSNGVSGTSTGTGYGVLGSGSGNSSGVGGIGAGTGPGVVGISSGATGSAPSNAGVFGVGTGTGVYGLGSGSGLGGFFQGGLTNGEGLEAVGYGTAVAVLAYMGDGNNSKIVIQALGYYGVGGDIPATTTSFTNTLTSVNTAKLTADINIPTADGACTVLAGFNVASATVASNQLTINFGGHMAGVNYVVLATNHDLGVSTTYYWYVESKTASAVVLKAKYWTTAIVDAPMGTGSGTSLRVNVVVFGEQ